MQSNPFTFAAVGLPGGWNAAARVCIDSDKTKRVLYSRVRTRVVRGKVVLSVQYL